MVTCLIYTSKNNIYIYIYILHKNQLFYNQQWETERPTQKSIINVTPKAKKEVNVIATSSLSYTHAYTHQKTHIGIETGGTPLPQYPNLISLTLTQALLHVHKLKHTDRITQRKKKKKWETHHHHQQEKLQVQEEEEVVVGVLASRHRAAAKWGWREGRGRRRRMSFFPVTSRKKVKGGGERCRSELGYFAVVRAVGSDGWTISALLLSAARSLLMKKISFFDSIAYSAIGVYNNTQLTSSGLS